jgi:hypothetical protein
VSLIRFIVDFVFAVGISFGLTAAVRKRSSMSKICSCAMLLLASHALAMDAKQVPERPEERTPAAQAGFAELLRSEFSAELVSFLDEIWRASARNEIDLSDYRKGWKQIYNKYSDRGQPRPYDAKALSSYLESLLVLSNGYPLVRLGSADDLHQYGLANIISTLGTQLWKAFLFVRLSKSSGPTLSRVYVHSADTIATIAVMNVIVSHKNGIKTVKCIGPGAARADTIVAYLDNPDGANALVAALLEVQRKHKEWFVDPLPQLVVRKGPGIGQAGQPPITQLFASDSPKDMSYGSFYARVAWAALRTTPKKGTHDDFLRNVLVGLGLLRIDPKQPHQFPEKLDVGPYREHYEDAIKPYVKAIEPDVKAIEPPVDDE